jgi:hypothetical protein
LRADPRRIPVAAEELLRRYTFTVPVRKVRKDVVFEGLQMREGERVMLFLPAADLDPKECRNFASILCIRPQFHGGPVIGVDSLALVWDV